jgi:hypothetical protein
MEHIPLASAYLCQDCNCVCNCAKQCAACPSAALMGLSGVLNRGPDVNLQQNYAHVPAVAEWFQPSY